MPMKRSTFPKDLEEGLNAHFGMEEAQYPEEWRRIFAMETSNKAQEEDVLEIGLGGAQVKPEGQDVAEDEGGQGWSQIYVHETIALSFSLTEEAIEDNLYARQGPKYARAMARSFVHTRGIKATAILNNARTVNGGDGVPTLSQNHPVWAGGTQSNTLGTPADIAEPAVEDLLIMIRRATDDRYIPQAFRPVDLVVPPEQEYNAIRVTKSPGQSGTDLNDINAMRQKGIFQKDPVVLTYLVAPDDWFITTNCNDGLKHIQRKALSRGMQEDFKTGNQMYKGRERYRNGISNWRGLYAA